MLRNDIFTVWFVTIYLFIYCILLQTGYAFDIASWMLLLSPVLILRMVYAVLKFGTYNGRELNENESGYQDYIP
jgi:hypothetical protein